MSHSEDSEEEEEMQTESRINAQYGKNAFSNTVIIEPLMMEPVLDVWRIVRDRALERQLPLLNNSNAGENLYEILCNKI